MSSDVTGSDLSYLVWTGQRARDGSRGRRAACRTQLSAASGVRPVRRAAVRHGIHRATACEPTDLALSHPSDGRPPSWQRAEDGDWRAAPFHDDPDPNRLRWDPIPLPDVPTDFVDGMWTVGGNGHVERQFGIGIHLYRANRSMSGRVLVDADGELLLVPQLGRLLLVTEMGRLEVRPGSIAVVPRGVRFRVELLDDTARGYVCENYGRPFHLPELGPIGSNGLANARDFARTGSGV